MVVEPVLTETCRMDDDIKCEFIFYPFSRTFNCRMLRNDNEQLVSFTGKVQYDGSEEIGRELPSKLLISDINYFSDNITDKDLDRAFRLFLLWVYCIANNSICVVCMSDYYACLFSDFVFVFYGPDKKRTYTETYTFRLSGNSETDIEVAKATALMFVKNKEIADSMMEYMLRHVPKPNNVC